MKTFLFLVSVTLLAIFFSGKGRAQAQCDDGYTLCMSGCATDRAAERCMQRCQEAERRCAKSGVFRMPIGFLLNRTRIEEMSSAQGELPQTVKNAGRGKRQGG
jgi:hypothetical protein